MDHWWGLKIEENFRGPVWGARALFSFQRNEKRAKRRSGSKFVTYVKVSEEIVIDLLPDRQSARGQKDDMDPLVRWINSRGIKLLKKQIKDRGIDQTSRALVVVEDKGYRLSASPNGSYGYLYMVAYPLP